MKPVLFNGCGTAIITPMKDDLSIHYELFGELLDQQLQQGSECHCCGPAPPGKAPP